MSDSSPSSQTPPTTHAPSQNGISEKQHDNGAAADHGEPDKAKKPSLKERAGKLWSKTQLDTTTMKIMAK
jgi:hypothetical protein